VKGPPSGHDNRNLITIIKFSLIKSRKLVQQIFSRQLADDDDIDNGERNETILTQRLRHDLPVTRRAAVQTARTGPVLRPVVSEPVDAADDDIDNGERNETIVTARRLRDLLLHFWTYFILWAYSNNILYCINFLIHSFDHKLVTVNYS